MYIPALSVVLANEKFIYISYLLNGCFFLALIELTGCQAMGKVDFGEAFVDAAKDPMTWGNLAGAAILQVGNLDKKISDHAIKKTPVFGSKDKAVDMSTELKKYTGLSMQLSILLVDEGEGSWGRYLGRKTVRFLGNNLSGQFANAVAHELQPAFHRTRPDGSANGFPSCHSTTVFSDSWFARKNYLQSNLPSYLSYSMIGITYLGAYGTAWARVEGEKHYPSDVLAGAAFGNFISAFINRLTNGFWLDDKPEVSLMVQPSSSLMSFSMSF